MQETQVKSREISTLPFTDLYLRLDDASVPARFRPDPIRTNYSGNLTVPASFNQDVGEIRSMLKDQIVPEGTLTYKGLRLRYARFLAAEGEMWAALRAVPLDLPSIEHLGLHPDFVRMVRGWGHRKGLVLVGGKTGDGKTTTCVAALRDYLERIGGLAYTCEDPIEFQLQGAVSDKGFCLQYEVVDDNDWNPAIKRAMRTRPDYIFVGEIRTPEAAEHLLKAATSGHLVLTTIHGGSVSDTISAILHLAENKLGPVARQIIADRLVAAVHQTLTKAGPRIQCIVPQDGSSDMIAQVIKGGDISNLSNQVKTYEPAKTLRSRPATA